MQVLVAGVTGRILFEFFAFIHFWTMRSVKDKRCTIRFSLGTVLFVLTRVIVFFPDCFGGIRSNLHTVPPDNSERLWEWSSSVGFGDCLVYCSQSSLGICPVARTCLLLFFLSRRFEKHGQARTPMIDSVLWKEERARELFVGVFERVHVLVNGKGNFFRILISAIVINEFSIWID